MMLKSVLLQLIVAIVPYSAVLQNTKYKVSNLTKMLILNSSPFVEREPWAVEYGSPTIRNLNTGLEGHDSSASQIHEVRVPPPSLSDEDRFGKALSETRKINNIKSSFEYKFEEPLYNIDTEPRFFKKTFDTISGFLTHTFSSEDAKKEDKAKKIKKVPRKPTHKPRPNVLKNPLENIKPLKFPSAIHNYQEAGSNVSPRPSRGTGQVKDDVRKPNDDSVMTSHNSPGGSLENNSWKPSQR